MVADDYFDHIAPDDETPLDRVRASGDIPQPRGRIHDRREHRLRTLYLATPGAIVAAWITSPEHLANILCARILSLSTRVVGAMKIPNFG
jgi:hypothetical protein